MIYKWIGAGLIVGSCGGFGIYLAHRQKREEALLLQRCTMIDDMRFQLPFQLTPLPELLRQAAGKGRGLLPEIFLGLAEQLDRQVLPDALCCMEAALSDGCLGYPRVENMLLLLGQSLGRFDLSGQLKGLGKVRQRCAREAEELRENRDIRLRSFRVLGLCAGAALAILLV